MASYKDLCRLCAKQHEYIKDLLDDNNKSILDIVLQYTPIRVTPDDILPTMICLDCEEKIISFQLFLLECCKFQDILVSMCNNECGIKTEDAVSYQILDTTIMSEVKAESPIHNNTQIGASDFVAGMFSLSDDVNNDVDGDYSDDDDEDDQDNISLAALKELKLKSKVIPSEKDLKLLSKILTRPNFKVRELVLLNCLVCDEKQKTWLGLRSHCVRKHKCKPIVKCLCGFVIESKAMLYKHVSEHKMQRPGIKRVENITLEKHDKARDFIDFKCITCEKQFLSFCKLKKHCERYHKEPPVVACKCGLVMNSETVMYQHVRDHKNPTEFACDQCTVVSKSLAALNKHKMRHIPKEVRKFFCSGCDKVFTNKELLKSHERMHIPIEARKVFQCNSCYMKFTTRSSLVSHIRVVHEKIKSYVCDLCGYACGTNGELRQHRAIHSEDKPFKCKTCNKGFKAYSNLKTHEDTHEDTSYVCNVCSRVLNSRRTLRKHLVVHEKKFHHICSYCNKVFKRRQTLKVHMSKHTGDKPEKCKWCDKRFMYASSLRYHRLRCHPDKVAQGSLNNDSDRQPSQNEQQDYIKADISAIQCSEAKIEVEAL